MCQGCYSSWSFVNEQCPLDSLDLAEPARVHQSRVWPCIPDEVWINELWTSNSRITPHKSSNPAQWNLQRTKMLEKSTSTLPRISVWTSWPGRGAAAAERIFQKPPIIWCVGEHNELGRMPNSILYQTNKTFDRTCLPFRGLHTNKLLMRVSDKRFSYSVLTDFCNLI